MRLPATLSLALFAAVSVRAEAPSIQGTLPEDYLPGLRPLLTLAVERSPQTVSASINLAAQEAAKYQYTSGLLPSLSANSSYEASKTAETNSPSSTSTGLFYGASVNQPIFQWGALKNNAAIGTLGVKIAERQFAEAYRLLAISIREQYMALIQKKVLLRNARFSLKLSQESMAAQQARFEAGASSQAELGNFRISVEQAQLDSDKSEEDFSYAKRVFTRLVGITALDDESIPLEMGHPVYSAPLSDEILSGFVGDGIESTFQSQVYKMMIRQQDLSYNIAKVRLLPKFAASAGYNLSDDTAFNPGGVSLVAVKTENIQIAANWAIFDGFATKGAKLSALTNKRLYEQQRQSYIDSTIDAITDMRRQLGFSARQMALTEVHHDLIAAEIKRLNADRELGFASQATIDSGLVTLYSTELQVAQVRSDYFGRWTEFVSQAGIDPAISNISPRYVR